MIIQRFQNPDKQCSAGDTVYAVYIKTQQHPNRVIYPDLYMPTIVGPIKGIFASSFASEKNPDMPRGRKPISFFVPFKEGTRQPDYEKRIHIHQCWFATTDQDAIKLNNQLIDNLVQEYRRISDKLKRQLKYKLD